MDFGQFLDSFSLENRKIHGIYYTPDYIAQYMCDRVISIYISNNKLKSLEEIKSIIRVEKESTLNHEYHKKLKEITIIDPSCGSGVFLINCGKILFELHKFFIDEKYQPKSSDEEIFEEIFTNNIFGLDLDKQSIENAKKKIIQTFFHKDSSQFLRNSLDNNIICGNALLNSSDLDINNKFRWEKDFKDVMEKGGFDIVIGNPPYVDIKQLTPESTREFFKEYETVRNRTNLYSIFLERALITILNSEGVLGFIIPNSILYNTSYSKIRKLILNKSEILEIIRMPDNIFETAVVETVILFLRIKEIKTLENRHNEIKIRIYKPKIEVKNLYENNEDNYREYFVDPFDWEQEYGFRFLIIDKTIRNIIKKIERRLNGDIINNERTVILKDICDFSLGITPYDKYRGHSKEDIKNKIFHSKVIKDESYKPLLTGSDIRRYNINFSEKGYIKYGDWLAAPRKRKFFSEPRIIVRQIISGKPPRIFAAYSEDELYNTQIAFSILKKESLLTSKIDIFYILGILNSKLMSFYHKFKFLDNTKITFQKILLQNIKLFPIRIVDESKAEKISNNVRQLIKLNEDHEKDMIDSEIDGEIDNMIYNFYGLNEEDMKIIEKEFSN